MERLCLKAQGRAFFLGEQRKPLHRPTVNLALRKYGEKAKLPVAVHPFMLRHACVFALADQGADTRLIQDYLGHQSFSTPCATPLPTRRSLRSCGGRCDVDGERLPKPGAHIRSERLSRQETLQLMLGIVWIRAPRKITYRKNSFSSWG